MLKQGITFPRILFIIMSKDISVVLQAQILGCDAKQQTFFFFSQRDLPDQENVISAKNNDQFFSIAEYNNVISHFTETI